MICPKCGSSNVNVQSVETGSVGMSKTTIVKKRKGLLYWLLVSWWIWIFKLLVFPFKLLFGSKKKIGTATTISGTKNVLSTRAVCQSCGYSWKP